jgi:hypothetical protein
MAEASRTLHQAHLRTMATMTPFIKQLKSGQSARERSAKRNGHDPRPTGANN